MKFQLFAAAAVVAMGFAACSESKPAETPVAEAPAPAPAPETPAPTPVSTIGETPADPAAFMKARHEKYEDLGKNFKVLLEATKVAAPDMTAVTAAAAKVKEYADQMGTWFPAGTGPEVTGVHTHAKPNVWTDRATFDTKLVALQAETTKLAAVTDAAGLKAQFGPTGGACKSCHETFREEDKDHK